MRKTSELIWQDAQHQVLFQILETIGRPGSGVDVLQQLHQYTETHFSLEEQYMELLDFPGREAHIQAHVFTAARNEASSFVAATTYC